MSDATTDDIVSRLDIASGKTVYDFRGETFASRSRAEAAQRAAVGYMAAPSADPARPSEPRATSGLGQAFMAIGWIVTLLALVVALASVANAPSGLGTMAAFYSGAVLGLSGLMLAAIGQGLNYLAEIAHNTRPSNRAG
ncbi:MAG TPA: hypothetical protein VEH84_10625 [Alphaproteobacteria bacterium]|nr:hypothetical protein [Alphaproteobacteria bacterium]